MEACIEFVCNVLNGGGTPNLQVLQLLVYSEGLNEVKETLNAYEGARTTDIQLIFTEYEVDPEDTDIRDEVRRQLLEEQWGIREGEDHEIEDYDEDHDLERFDLEDWGREDFGSLDEEGHEEEPGEDAEYAVNRLE